MTGPRKKVLIKITVEHIIDVPQEWDKDMINFHLSDSSHCASNDLLDAAEDRFRDDGTSSWLDLDAVYVRDATEEDLMLLEGSGQLS